MRARNWTNLKRIEQTSKGCRKYLKRKFVIKKRVKQIQESNKVISPNTAYYNSHNNNI